MKRYSSAAAAWKYWELLGNNSGIIIINNFYNICICLRGKFLLARTKQGSTVKKKSGKIKKPDDKKKYIGSWTDKKLVEVWEGLEANEYDLGDEDKEILMEELKARGLRADKEEEAEGSIGIEDSQLGPESSFPLKRGPFGTAEVSKDASDSGERATGSDIDEDEEEEEQVPIGYIRIYPETPERNELYRKRYENARKAWGQTKIIQKGEKWFIVAKGDAEFGYDVHLYDTSNGAAFGTCTCADFTQRGIRRSFPCKHIFMVLVHQGFTEKWQDVK
jgi:hypothetical protein